MVFYYCSKAQNENKDKLSIENVTNSRELSRKIDSYRYLKTLQKSDKEIMLYLLISEDELEMIEVLELAGRKLTCRETGHVTEEDSQIICRLSQYMPDLETLAKHAGIKKGLTKQILREEYLDYTSSYKEDGTIDIEDWRAVESLIFLAKSFTEIAEIIDIPLPVVQDMSYEILDSYESRRKKNENLRFDDMIVLQHQAARGISNRKIAKQLHCSHSTVGSELRKAEEKYSAVKSYNQRKETYHNKRGPYKLRKAESFLDKFEEEFQEQKCSVAGFCEAARVHPENEFYDSERVCPKTLYKYIKEDYLEVKESDLPRGFKVKETQIHIEPKENKRSYGKSIEERPDIEKEPFHWEIDTVIGKREKDPVLLTLRERVSNFGVMFPLESKKSKHVNSVIEDIINRLGDWSSSVFKTITTDNGTEFAHLSKLPKIGTNVYYAHPGTPTDKPNVERFNEQVREFYKKGESLKGIREQEVLEVMKKINDRPVKSLNWASPHQVFLVFLRGLLNGTPVSPEELCL